MIHDVAIIGAGPVGLTLANLLGRRGRSVCMLERQPAPYPMPRAIHFDGEAMRVFQATGLAEQILPHTHVGKGMLFVDGAGKILVDWSRDQAVGPMGWHESYRFHQPGVEQALRRGLGRFAHVTLRSGAEVTALAQDSEDVTLRLANGGTVRARFAIGADGSGSRTRQALGIGLHDLGFQERWLVVDALLTRARPDLGDHSVQYCDPDAPATYVRGAGNWRRWEMRLDTSEPDATDEPQVWAKLARWITPRDGTLERAAVYTFRSRIADIWRQGRVLLAGDAAHQMPPFMGQGMCAGLRDAANLAWKLDAVLNGADDALLDSYQSERDPNARAFIETSVALGHLINQTAAGQLPQGRMRSIWPDLGPGLGPRDGDGAGGSLAPQVIREDGQRTDDAAQGGFHILAADSLPDAQLPCFTGAQDWLARRNLTGAILRPDGYCLAGFATARDLTAVTAPALQLNAHLSPAR